MVPSILRASRYAKTWLRRHLLQDLPARRVRRFVEGELNGRVVLSGPFRGLVYGERTSAPGLIQASAYYPKLLGTYEKEIAPFIEELINSDLERVVDVGAAEGYYAVGFALKTKAHVVGFEAHGPGPMLELAARNGVEDRVAGYFIGDAGSLRDVLTGTQRTLLMMDIEGAESVLLDPLIVPPLRTTEILVEVHDCFLPGTSALLKKRFYGSHRIEEVWSRPRTPEDFPLRFRPGWFNPSMYYLDYLGERSVKTSWMYFRTNLA